MVDLKSFLIIMFWLTLTNFFRTYIPRLRVSKNVYILLICFQILFRFAGSINKGKRNVKL